MLHTFHDFLNTANGIVWGPLTLVLLLGTGIYLTAGLRAMPWRKVVTAFRLMWQGRRPDGEGDITPFQALMTSLSATIGTGNIAGVATAIAIGGPGAVFWMWITALFGMATKYCECVLAIHYREVDAQGKHVGGPMYYIKNGLAKKWHWLAVLFAIFGALAGFGIGNMVQANSVADAIQNSFNIPTWVSGVVMAVLTAVVILGGITRLAAVSAKLVPFMAIIYVAGAMTIILGNITEVPTALATIVTNAFTGTAAVGGFTGAAVWAAIQFGVARGIFSNEAGMGSAPIAHAAAQSNDAVQQGLIGMLGTFIDTLIVCTMTALVIVITGVWSSGATGATLSSMAFESALPGVGNYIVVFGLITFAFTTILGWSYYGERCAAFLFGVKVILPYRILWVLAIPLGAMLNLELVWTLADVLNGLMVLPNLIALLLLSPLVFKISHDYFKK